MSDYPSSKRRIQENMENMEGAKLPTLGLSLSKGYPLAFPGPHFGFGPKMRFPNHRVKSSVEILWILAPTGRPQGPFFCCHRHCLLPGPLKQRNSTISECHIIERCFEKWVCPKNGRIPTSGNMCVSSSFTVPKSYIFATPNVVFHHLTIFHPSQPRSNRHNMDFGFTN